MSEKVESHSLGENIFREDLIVHAGKTNPRYQNVLQRKIRKFSIHPKFQLNNYKFAYYYDIALIIVEKVRQKSF